MGLALSMLEVRFLDVVHIATRTLYEGAKTQQKKPEIFNFNYYWINFWQHCNGWRQWCKSGKQQTTLTCLLRIEAVKPCANQVTDMWVCLEYYYSSHFFLEIRELCVLQCANIHLWIFHRTYRHTYIHTDRQTEPNYYIDWGVYFKELFLILYD